ncbi:energy-coupling factor transporter transmembrane component T family protein [Slackia exigua]
MARRPSGILRLDPRTHMGLLLTMTLIAFVVKPFVLEAGLVAALALLQVLCGHAKMAMGYIALFALIVWTLDYAFAAGAAVFLTSFVYSFTLARRAFEVFMVGALMVADNSMHRITAAMRKLRFPEAILIPFATGLRYFPTLGQEIGHIRDAMRLRDIPVSMRVEAFFVPLMMSAATTADELSRAAVCRGIDNPTPRSDTERLLLGVADWALLAIGAVVCLCVLLRYGAGPC